MRLARGKQRKQTLDFPIARCLLAKKSVSLKQEDELISDRLFF
ncbi:MAG: hypothetical protein WBV68_05445 [Exiguobacterium oxidotolerans]